MVEEPCEVMAVLHSNSCNDLIREAYFTALSLKEALGATQRARLTGFEATRALQNTLDLIMLVDMLIVCICWYDERISGTIQRRWRKNQ